MSQQSIVQEDLFAPEGVLLSSTPIEFGSEFQALDVKPPRTKPLKQSPLILDLFSGMGGIALGFQKAGFEVVGVDQNGWTAELFQLHDIGTAVLHDLADSGVYVAAPVVTGGPPCRPWTIINQQLRRDEHPDQPLLNRFFEHVYEIQPEIFLMENVPLVQSDPVYKQWLRTFERLGYSVGADVLAYSNFGAATARMRLFTIGVRHSRRGALEFFLRIRERMRPPTSIGSLIRHLSNVGYGEAPDHVWPLLTTISDYVERYETGQYGWRRLDYDEPAPSFGNLTKTYVLHPAFAPTDVGARVLSVRELSLIMGFPADFYFPDGMPLAMRYQMLADSVSPVFSKCCADVIREMLWEP